MACRQLGMKMAVYCSPWDRNNAAYGKPEYVTDVYRKQLEELYTNYGPLFMSWHDGANGGDGYYGGSREVRKIDRSNYYGWPDTWAITRKMQPGADIFGDVGPDVRWVGNEEGYAGETYWATYTPEAPESGKIPSNGYAKDDLGTEGTRNGKYWMPAECDVPLRGGWFYHASQDGQTRSAYNVLNLYYKSVGRGACLDLGLSPDKDGLITDEDAAVLKQFGQLLKETFAVNLAKGATFKASNIRGKNNLKFGPANLLDNDRYTYWATDDNVTKPELIIDLHGKKTFNVIRLRENIKLGQRIEGAIIDTWQNGGWQQAGVVSSIGANKLIRLPQNITAQKIKLRITGSPVCIALSDFGLFKEPVHLTAPIISRNETGMVIIQTTAPVTAIHYTTDGSVPGINSPVFKGPFAFVDGGLVKAVATDNHKTGEVASQNFGLIKKDWKIMPDKMAKADSYPAYAIDENQNTLWNTVQKDSTRGFEQAVVSIYIGNLQPVTAITYLPRQDKKIAGIADRYIIYTSDDGTDWTEAASGEFSNIKSNPVEQVIHLKQPVNARYIRFRATHVINGNGVTAAEIGVEVK